MISSKKKIKLTLNKDKSSVIKENNIIEKKVQEKELIDSKQTDIILDTLNEKFSDVTHRLDVLSSNNFKKNEFWDLGHISLNQILGGGLPKGCIIEVYGKEGTGKTTLGIQILNSVLKLSDDYLGYYINAESVINFNFLLEILGKNRKKAYFGSFSEAESTLDLILELCNIPNMKIIVIDSIAGLFSKNALSKNNETGLASLARVLSSYLPQISKLLSANGTTLVLINQLRQKINVGFSPFGAGQSETTAGGNAIKFFSSVRLELTRIGLQSDKEEINGSRVRFKTIKNRFALPFKEEIIELTFGKGFLPLNDLINKALELDIIKRSGSYYDLLNERLCQGKENLNQLLINSTNLYNKVYNLTMEKLNSPVNMNNKQNNNELYPDENFNKDLEIDEDSEEFEDE